MHESELENCCWACDVDKNPCIIVALFALHHCIIKALISYRTFQKQMIKWPNLSLKQQ